MPPRPSRRRQPRFSVREPDTLSYQNPITFQKPNLPPLQGTPSSRRQYSYGAEVEPMPTRPTHGQTEEEPRDIGTAVRHVLVPPGVNNEEQQNDQGGRGESLPSQKEPQKPKIAEPEPDELAGGQLMRPPHLPSCKIIVSSCSWIYLTFLRSLWSVKCRANDTPVAIAKESPVGGQ